MTTRRCLLKAASVLTVGAVLGLGISPAIAETKKVRLQLAWLVNAAAAGEIVALKKGYFAEKGLDVEILPGGPGSSPIQETLAGVAEIAIAYAPQILHAGNQKLPIKSFAASYTKAPLTFFSLGESNIKSIADWRGKTIGAGSDAEAQVRAILEHNGMSIEDITLVQAQPPALMQGQVDVVAAWPTNVAQIEPITSNPGGYNTQSIWDNGLQFQSNYYVARTPMIEGDTETLVSFLEAVDMGWSFAADNPEEAVAMLLEMAPSLDGPLEVEALKVMFSQGFIYNEETLEKGFGNIEAGRWQDTIDLYVEIGEIQPGLTAADIFDDRVLIAAQRTKR